MREATQDSDTFSREFFWSPAHDFQDDIGWKDIVDRNARKVIGTVCLYNFAIRLDDRDV